MTIEFFSKNKKAIDWLGKSSNKLGFFFVALVLLVITSTWVLQNYFSVTKIEVKAIDGKTKVETRDGSKLLSKGDKSEISVGDKITVSDQSSAMIVLSNGESYLLSEDERLIFSRLEKDVRGSSFYFTDLEKGKEIVVNTNPSLTKNSAAVLSNISLLPPPAGQVLGASDQKLSQSQKYEKFLAISICVEKDKETKNYSQNLQKCLQQNNLETLADLN
ncbi:MAG: hypothetical protein WCK98_00735 [bacterium]